MFFKKEIQIIMLRLKSKYIWPIEHAIAHAKLQILMVEARRLNAHLAYTLDPQGKKFHVLTLENPLEGKVILAAHLYPGVGMDVYFPAPLIPCEMWAKAFTEKQCYCGSLGKGLKAIHAAHRRLLSYIEFEKAQEDIRSSIQQASVH